tara:strand:- start:172 stop:348 length:177 start_codon:yes stop_codon:yes gene_type:complete
MVKVFSLRIVVLDASAGCEMVNCAFNRANVLPGDISNVDKARRAGTRRLRRQVLEVTP